MLVSKKFINKLVYIEKEGAAVVKSMSNVDDTMLFGKGDNKYYLVPLRAVDSQYIDDIVDMVESRTGDKFDIEELFQYTITGKMWENTVYNSMLLPIKGENVVANFEYNDAEEIVCTFVKPIEKMIPKKFDLSTFKLNKNHDE